MVICFNTNCPEIAHGHLASFRSDEAGDSPFLKEWDELQRKTDIRLPYQEVKVGPLTLEECYELLPERLSRDDNIVQMQTQALFEETGGNPFFLTELLRYVDPDAEDTYRTLTLIDVIRRKLDSLPAEARRLLEVIAISGQASSIDDAFAASGEDIGRVTFNSMAAEKLIRRVGADEDRVDTYHDKVRETVLANMSVTDKRATHLVLATTIQRRHGLGSLSLDEEIDAQAAPTSLLCTLASHFDAAGEVDQALALAVLAAEQSGNQSALDVAAEQYAIAKRNMTGGRNTLKYRILEGYGSVLMLSGRYAEATEQLSEAFELTDDSELKARIEVLQGELAFKQGAVDEAKSIYESGLRRLGIWVPKSRLGLMLALARESVVQAMHTLLPFLRHRKRNNSRRELTARLMHRVNHPYVFSNTLKLMWGDIADVNRAELTPPSPQLSFSFALHACAMLMLGLRRRGVRFGRRAMELAGTFDDIWGQGYCNNYLGIGYYASARYEDGLGSLVDAVEAFNRAGDPYELHLAKFHKGCCHFGLGNLPAAIDEARTTLESSSRISDSRVMCSSYLWARATRGDIPFERIQPCYPCRSDDVMSTVHGLMAEGQWHGFHGRTKESLSAFEKAATMVWKTFCVNSHTLVVMPMLVGALRAHAETVEPNEATQAKQLRMRAYRLAKWATRITWLFPAAYPIALRERSRILQVFGKKRQALKFAAKSCRVAENQQAIYELAQSQLLRGQLAQQLGRADAAEQIGAAERKLDEFHAAVNVANHDGEEVS